MWTWLSSPESVAVSPERISGNTDALFILIISYHGYSLLLYPTCVFIILAMHMSPHFSLSTCQAVEFSLFSLQTKLGTCSAVQMYRDEIVLSRVSFGLMQSSFQTIIEYKIESLT